MEFNKIEEQFGFEKEPSNLNPFVSIKNISKVKNK
jgi:hypothetical protein